jgi:hypothetical protein
MDTSASNSLATLLIAEFLAEETNQHVEVIAEGDDNLCNWSCSVPSAEMYAALGVTAKIDLPSDIESASFCGIVFSPEDGAILTNPYSQLVRFAWADGSYAGSSGRKKLVLLRVKALSTLYQFPGCPVVQELALMALRLSHGTPMIECCKEVLSKRAAGIGGSFWVETVLTLLRRFERGDLPSCAVTSGSRFQMERVYGMSVQSQLSLEAILRNHVSGPLRLDGFAFPSAWAETFERNVVVGSPHAPTYAQDVCNRVLVQLKAAGVSVEVRLPPARRR